jgi:hypothetical protein
MERIVDPWGSLSFLIEEPGIYQTPEIEDATDGSGIPTHVDTVRFGIPAGC